MGILNYVFGKKNSEPRKLQVEADRLWSTVDAKLDGIAHELGDVSSPDTLAILIIAHFSDPLARLEQLIQKAHIPVRAVLASSLNSELATKLNLDASSNIDIVIAERHPLRSFDHHIHHFAEQLPCRAHLTYHISLDDALFRRHPMLPAIKRILAAFGDGSPIENARMRHKFVGGAQQTVAASACSPYVEAENAEEWITKNCTN